MMLTSKVDIAYRKQQEKKIAKKRKNEQPELLKKRKGRRPRKVLITSEYANQRNLFYLAKNFLEGKAKGPNAYKDGALISKIKKRYHNLYPKI